MSDEKAKGLVTTTVTIPTDDRAWLIRQAADRAAETGERASVSAVLRDMIAANRSGRAA